MKVFFLKKFFFKDEILKNFIFEDFIFKDFVIKSFVIKSFVIKSFVFQTLAPIYGFLVFLRNCAFDFGIFKPQQVQCPVISVGNVTVGGTGKTPITNFILKYLIKKKMKVALVSRSYKAEANEPVKVEVGQNNAAAFYGDEPLMLRMQNPEVSVFVGRHKAKVAQFAQQQSSWDVMVVDDGFQHRQLFRNLNLVLLDMTEPILNYRLLPLGRGRESLKSLRRSDLLILTKTNLVDEEKILDLQKIIPIDLPTVCFSFHIGPIYPGLGTLSGPISMQEPQSDEIFAPKPGDRIFLIAGVAKPQLFVQMVRQRFPKCEYHLIPFQDHHPYTLKDCELIDSRIHFPLSEEAEAGAEVDSQTWVMTTVKDWVKLKPIWVSKKPIWVADLEVQIESGQEVFYEKIDQCFS